MEVEYNLYWYNLHGKFELMCWEQVLFNEFYPPLFFARSFSMLCINLCALFKDQLIDIFGHFNSNFIIY